MYVISALSSHHSDNRLSYFPTKPSLGNSRSDNISFQLSIALRNLRGEKGWKEWNPLGC